MLQLAVELVLWLTFPRTNSFTFLLLGVATLCLLYAARIIPTIRITRTHTPETEIAP